jgi:hypothetical protein
MPINFVLQTNSRCIERSEAPASRPRHSFSISRICHFPSLDCWNWSIVSDTSVNCLPDVDGKEPNGFGPLVGEQLKTFTFTQEGATDG